jgi:hypothetical protein
MMLVNDEAELCELIARWSAPNDAPPSRVLAETPSEPKVELSLPAATEVAAATNGGRERHIVRGLA